MQLSETPDLLLDGLEDALDAEYIGHLLSVNHRILYEFFDKQEVLVTVDHVHTGLSTEWYSIVNGVEGKEWFTARYEAEVDGFVKAFETLENKLNDTVTGN